MHANLKYAVMDLLMHTSVINSSSECTDVDQIRLTEDHRVPLTGTVRGRIEICSNHSSDVYSWERLCDDNWTVEDITVACRNLGYSDSSK